MVLSAGSLWGFRAISASEVSGQPDVAIGGYDVVAYFTEEEPVRGRAILQSRWKGARWFFATQEHRKMFEADPEKYAPAYGGYCAMCVSATGDATTAGDPEIFLLHEGRLFLLQDEAMRREWLKDLDGHTEKAAAAYARLVAESEANASAEG